MSHFYGYLQGNRGETTRCGSRQSGIRAHIRSWSHDIYATLWDGGRGDKLSLRIPTDENLEIEINGAVYEFNQNGELVKTWIDLN